MISYQLVERRYARALPVTLLYSSVVAAAAAVVLIDRQSNQSQAVNSAQAHKGDDHECNAPCLS